MKDFLQKISKRDLLYLLGFVVYNFFVLLIWRFSSVEILVHQLSFAASLVSILLAFFAMIYVWLQTKEMRKQAEWITESLKITKRKMEELNRLETQIFKQVSDHSKISEGVQVISKGLKQLKQQKSLSKNAKKQIEILEKKNQDLMDHVVGLSDLSMIYHTEEINSIANVLNKYAVGEWFALKEIISKMRVVDPSKPDQDVQNMVLFYLAHLNLLGYVRSNENQYTRVKEIPLIERKG